MLTIKKLSAVIDTKELLKNINLNINAGEIHALIGPPKSGKSSLAHIIAGHPDLIQSDGTILFNNKDLKKLDSEDRSLLGIYTIFQYTPDLEGISNFDLLKLILKARKDKRSDQKIEQTYKKFVTQLGLRPDNGSIMVSQSTMSRSELKKNELIQMLMIDPELVIIDDLDEDLSKEDIFKIAETLVSFLDESKSLMVITNDQEFLDLLKPQHVHILVEGEIKLSGDSDLYKRIIKDGYSQFS